MPFEINEGPDGKPIAVKATADGAQRVAVGSIEGSGMATEETLGDVKDAAETLASTVVLAPAALASDPGVNAKISASVTIPVEVVAGQLASATPDASAAGVITRLAGVTTEAAGEAAVGLSTVAYQGGAWSATVEASPERPVHTRGVDDLGNSERQATEATATAIEEAVDELEEDADAARIAAETIATLAVESLGNSSTTPLGIGATFTGAWIDALQFVDIRVLVKADVASAIDGLHIEQSHDGISAISDDEYSVPANRGKTYAVQRSGRYIRVRYVNGAIAQSSFVLQTILSRGAGIQNAHNIGRASEISDEDDAGLHMAVLVGSAPDGGWRATRVDRYRRLTVVTAAESSPLHADPMGELAIGTTTETFVVSPVYTEQTTNAQRSIVSTNAQDGPAGTGIRSVVIEYYDAALNGPFFEVVLTNGLTPVDTVAGNICYIEKMYGLTGGSSGAAVGDVQLKAASGGGGVTIWSIAATRRQTFGAHHYVAPDAETHVSSAFVGVDGNGPATFYLLAASILTPNYMWRQVGPKIRIESNGNVQSLFSSPVNVIGPGRIVVAIKRDGAAGTLTYFGSFSYYLNADV